MPATSSASAASPRARYDADLASGRIVADPAQAAALVALERLHGELLTRAEPPRRALLDRLRGVATPRWQRTRGLYLWGPVGRGKTYLVDTFFASLPFVEKTRIHFHNFMRRTHEALKGQRQQADPLRRVAADWARELRVLCLDEFHVGDITDAMLLANLLAALFEEGVTLLATSNEAPAMLYRGGLQRERFLPAIALLERELEVLELAGAQDYRLRALEQAPVYYVGPARARDDELAAAFARVAGGAGERDTALLVEGRPIATRERADGVAWFDFAALCASARSTIDYIEIARCHHTLLIGDVPVFGGEDNDPARRFINLIDELYDRNVNLVLAAAAEPEALYQGTRLAQAFQRTASRLREMRSHAYLARPHVSD